MSFGRNYSNMAAEPCARLRMAEQLRKAPLAFDATFVEWQNSLLANLGARLIRVTIFAAGNQVKYSWP